MVRMDRNCRVALASLLATAAFASADDVHAESRATLDVSLGGKAASNPFDASGSNTSDVAASLDIRPAFSIEDEVSSVVLDGQFHADRYFDRYKEEYSGAVGLKAARQLAERTSLSGNAAFRTSRSIVQDILFARPGELIEAPEIPAVPLPDVTVAGRRSRSNAFTAGLGLKHALSPVDSIGLTVDGGLFKYNSAVDADYRSANAGLQYSRSLSERTSLTASVGVGLVDYIDRRAGDGYFLTPLVGIKQQLSQTMTASAEAGISYSSTESSTGARSRSTGLSGSASLCDRRDNSAICASAARRARPTALGGVSTVTSFALTYDRTLSLRDRLSFSGRYARSKRTAGLAIPLTPDEQTEILGFSGSLQHTFNDRLSGFVTPSYTKVYDDVNPRKANYQVAAGVTYRFGKLR